MRNPNRGSPLNSSIDVLIGVRIAFLPKCLLVLSLLKHRGVEAFLTKKWGIQTGETP